MKWAIIIDSPGNSIWGILTQPCARNTWSVNVGLGATDVPKSSSTVVCHSVIVADIAKKCTFQLLIWHAYLINLGESNDVPGLKVSQAFLRYDFDEAIEKDFFFWQTNITGGKAFTCNNSFMKTRGLRHTYVRSGNAEATVRIVAVL
jgi:hypothetical protein